MCNKVCNYKNYVTFTIALYFSSDRQGAALAEELKNRAINQALKWESKNSKIEWNHDEKVKFALEDNIKMYFEGLSHDFDNSIKTQIYNASLDMVDWLELAEDILNE